MEVYGVVYLILNKVNGKPYVGQTTHTVEARFNQHSKCKTTVIGRAIHKYGRENFRCDVLKRCYSKAELDAWEKFFIAALKTKSPIGYNLTDGGEGTAGMERSPEYCAKLSAAQKGREVSAETRAKLATANTGKHLSKEARAKLAAANMGNKRALGYHHTDDARARISAASKGVQKSSEACANISAALKGRQVGSKNHNYGKNRAKTTCFQISVAQRGDSPFRNLLNELDKHQLSYAALAKLMGFASESNISDKMRCKEKFTERDATKLEKIFDKPAEYLLACDPEVLANFSGAKPRNSPFKNLIAELDKRHMSYRALAKLMDLSQSNISNKMNDKQKFTERDKPKLEEIFGKPIEYLLKRSDS